MDTILQTHGLRSALPAGGTATHPEKFLIGSRHAEHARLIGDALPAALKDAFALLRLNILSSLLIKRAFTPSDDGRSPGGSVDDSCDPTWWSAANTTGSLAAAADIQLCSYHCENDGRLFVHLVPLPGHGASEVKSRSKLSGHTDASALPLPNEGCGYADVAPSPDLVILTCIRNPDGVETRIAPLSQIHKTLEDDAIAVLKRPLFDFRPQASFSMAATYVNREKPVLWHDQNLGLLIRFSHSKVTSDSEEGRQALEALKASIATSFVGIALSPGDILFVNNRTALHGRSDIPLGSGSDRWLLRTYGMYARQPSFAVGASQPYLLLPEADGPRTTDTRVPA